MMRLRNHASLSLIAAEELLDRAAGSGGEYGIESKVLILLTDGQQNSGEFTPEEAAEFAAANEIKVYTIAIGSRDSFRSVNQGLLGAFQLFTGEMIDTKPIERVARITGGEFAKAADGTSLRRIYERIDELERSPFEHKFVRYKEKFQAFVGLGILLIVIEVMLSATWLRRVP